MNKTNLIIRLAAVLAVGAWDWSRRPSHGAGEPASDFTAQLIDGRTVHLSDLKGRYVLLQFWGSWCGPCRAENPHLLDLYNKFHDKGFDIFSVGLERDARSWKRAIEQDGMIWPWHTSDLKDFDNAIARQYNVKSIPMTFLINREGIIVGVDLSPQMLNKMLSEALEGQ